MSTVPPVVLLAAGAGSRLGAGDAGGLPKPLVTVRGTTLAAHSLGFFTGLGLRRFVVVVGFAAERVAAHFRELASVFACEVEIVSAAGWERGNGVSALAARDAIGGAPFLLAMADHLFLSPAMGRRVLAVVPSDDEVTLGVDFDRAGVFDIDDLTKVRVREGRIVGIGKTLRAWDGGDTGLFHGTTALFDALAGAGRRRRFGLSDAIRSLARRGKVLSADVTGSRWIDVDTPAARAEAERLLDAAQPAPQAPRSRQPPLKNAP